MKPNKPDSLVRIIPLGGLEEIGKNMTLIEYGDDIVIIDMGLMFPGADMPGVDYLIPDVTYLEERKERIRGVIITHGHLDHTGALPYLIKKLGLPPVYGTAVTLGMLKGRLEEFGLLSEVTLKELRDDRDTLKLGAFTINTFRLLHNIPGALGLEIETPNGRIAYCTDWKFDYTPADGKGLDLALLAEIGTRGVDLLLSDSTGADKPGHTVSERVVEQALAKAIEDVKGRLIIGTMSTMLNRVQQILNIAGRTDRKVLFVGRSMVQNVEMAVGINAIVAPPGVIISEAQINSVKTDKLIIVTVGSQGEDKAALGRMANHQHRVVKIRPGDTVMISASVIPGNERSVGLLKQSLFRAGATVISQKYLDLDIHASGHGHQDDLKLMIALMQPKYFMPLHGESHHLRIHRELAMEVGVPSERIIVGDNGSVLEIAPGGIVRVGDTHAKAGMVIVDGKGVGDIGAAVLKERQLLAREGFVQVFGLYGEHGLLAEPEVISRGFVHAEQNGEILAGLKEAINSFLGKAFLAPAFSEKETQSQLRDLIGRWVGEHTGREPMVLVSLRPAGA